MPAVLVTGGGSGIGAEVCRFLDAVGWTAFAADLAPPAGGHLLDTTDEAGWDRVLDAVGPLDGLVNCAGIRDRAALETMELSSFRRMMDVHVTGAFLGIRGMARRWKAQGRSGSIVTIGWAGRRTG